MDEQNGLKPDLVYEETPIMEPIPEPAPVVPPVQKKHRFGFLKNLIFFLVLFGLGVWLSSFLRQNTTPEEVVEIPSPTQLITPVILPTEIVLTPTPTGIVIPENWVSYEIVGQTYSLPPEVKPPVCDSGCVSYGTNLPGGTRLTIAPRGKGQKLPDFRNAILTDANGRRFIMSYLTIGDKQVYEYVGDFSGSTIQGYSFSKIRGLLVSVNDTLSIEFNHFTPLGKEADFAGDDLLFDHIVASVKIL